MYKIVIIEDDPNVRDNIKKILTYEGYETFGAATGEEGIEKIPEINPDLIICDIMLPDISGYDILETLNNSPKFKLIPFIFLTAKVEMDDLRRGMNLGADDYLTKPFHVKDLLEVVKVRISKSKLKLTNLNLSESKTSKQLQTDQRIFMPEGSSAQFIIVGDIIYIASEGSSTIVSHKDGHKIRIRKLLKEWEEVLPEKVFVRINKSTIVNLNMITKVEKWFNKSYRVFLQGNPEAFLINKSYASRLSENL